jgi:hypothetical protein
VREEGEAGLKNISSQPKDNTQYRKMKAVAVAPCQHHLTSITKCGEGVVHIARYCPTHGLKHGIFIHSRLRVLRDDVAQGGGGGCER